MRIVTALGGNALLRRGQALTAENQRANTVIAAKALARIALDHQLIVTHGNGPQVGLLALQGHAYKPDEAYPLDVLGAQTDGMIGYMIEQELGNWLPFETPLATLLTMVEVDRDDPAFDAPTKFVGPVYDKEEADRIAAQKGWQMRADGDAWRRVVPSPLPRRIFQLRPIKWLVEQGTVVICAGGGGIPTAYNDAGDLEGVEAVIDKDFASALLAREIGADLFISATDAEAVFLDWGTPDQRAIKIASPDALERHSFAAGSMGPKVAAACQFVRKTGKTAAIGSLSDLSGMVAGKRGTLISTDVTGITFHDTPPERGPVIGEAVRHGT
ncbi:carbamate kinase [Tateyamaria omphalii]|uniref:carbamate kinase n=1 Tax=Tateyamaria omphalii TaxID=299262 RepID=UPI001C99678D|nr:carbamate kinase [Tateyamaria omphalii]MBY5935038.1 carbamate kinase [Tateyamaria omphalii]